MPLTTITKLGSIGALAIFMVSPVFAGPQDDGLWSQPFEFDWPVENVNTLMTSQGKILSIGRAVGATPPDDYFKVVLDVWNPELGTDASSHNTISNNDTIPNIRGYSSVLMPETGGVLISGGADPSSATPFRTNSVGDFIFDTLTNTVSITAKSAATSQQSYRNNASSTILPSGEILIGGVNREGLGPDLLPEIYSPATDQWRTLSDAKASYFDWIVPSGKVVSMGFFDGQASSLDPSANGSDSLIEGINLATIYSNPVMYRPGKTFWAGGNWPENDSFGWPNSSILGFNEGGIYERKTNSSRPYLVRYSPNSILLPTGNVLSASLVVMGTGTLQTTTTRLEIWDAATESWSLMAEDGDLASNFHMILLSDGRVLSLTTDYSESLPKIVSKTFSPPYLFDPSGELAERPEVVSASVQGSYSGRVTVKHGTDSTISRVTLVTAGRNESTRSVGQHFIELDFDDITDGVNVKLPDSANTAPPGYYIMYLIDNKGVPSKGHMISLGALADDKGVYPTATADYVTFKGDVSITIDALANDTGSGLTLNAPNVWSLKGGNVALVNNKITYKPKAGFNGEDKIWYTFKDNQGRSNSGVIIITVSGNASGNSPFPTASQDNITATTSTATVIDVLANDTGVGLVLNAPNVWSLNGGRVSLKNNKLTYISKTGFTGSDKIWYTFKDVQGRSNSGQVNITVTSGSNTAFPIAKPDYYSTSKNTGKNLNILANDTGSGWKAIDTLYQYTAKGGTTYKTPEGQVWYTPKAGFTGEDNFWYVMIDSKGRKNSAQVKITVTQ